jgi:hypothetical protein
MIAKHKHFNAPQLRSLYISAPSEVAIMSRATGKTVGILAPKTAQCYLKTMPRGTGAIIAATYTQAFTRTLKELIRGFQSLGYIYNHHFIVGKTPSDSWKKKWKFKEPYAPPLDYKYFMTWFNGALGQIMSQDRPGSANGTSIDWIIGDEARLLNQEKFEEDLVPANRGFIPEFANNPYHHGITLTTDMPVGTAGRWLLDKVNGMNKQAVNDIWQLQLVKYKLTHNLLPKANKGYQKELLKQIEVIDAEMNDLRKGLLYYHEASTIANIHAVGLEYIKQQFLQTSEFRFDTQILNIKPMRLADGFYPDFDEEYHGYFSEEASYFDNLEIDYLNPKFDCRKDKDLDPNQPLHISLDYNRRMYPLEVGQVYNDEVRVINSLQVLYPGKVKDVVKLFTEYYKPHPRKFVMYWYDQTATSEQRETRLCDDVIAALRSAGWIVQPMYIGSASSYKIRYEMWGDLLKDYTKYNKKFRINRENCAKPILSINQAGVKQGKDGYEKDKSTESQPNFPADESTHHSEALDTLAYGLLLSGLNYNSVSRSSSGIIIAP